MYKVIYKLYDNYLREFNSVTSTIVVLDTDDNTVTYCSESLLQSLGVVAQRDDLQPFSCKDAKYLGYFMDCARHENSLTAKNLTCCLDYDKFKELFSYCRAYSFYPDNNYGYYIDLLNSIVKFSKSLNKNLSSINDVLLKICDLYDDIILKQKFTKDIERYNKSNFNIIPYCGEDVFYLLTKLRYQLAEQVRMERLVLEETFDSIVLKRDKLSSNTVSVSDGDFLSTSIVYLLRSGCDKNEMNRLVNKFKNDFCKDALNYVINYSKRVKYISDLEPNILKIDSIRVRYNFHEVWVTIKLRDEVLALKSNIENKLVESYKDKHFIV